MKVGIILDITQFVFSVQRFEFLLGRPEFNKQPPQRCEPDFLPLGEGVFQGREILEGISQQVFLQVVRLSCRINLDLEAPVRERFKELEERALSTLSFTGKVRLVEIDPSNNTLGLGPTDARTRSNDDASLHEICVLEDSYATNGTILHEFCHVRTNELGFKKVELDLVEATADSCTTAPRRTARYQVLYVIAEPYADSVLFTRLRLESMLQMTQTIMGYSDPLKIQQDASERGFLGIGGAAAFRVSLEWAGITGQDIRLSRAAERGLSGSDLEKYALVHSTLVGLPRIAINNQLQPFDNQAIRRIVEAGMSLYLAETGNRSGP